MDDSDMGSIIEENVKQIGRQKPLGSWEGLFDLIEKNYLPSNWMWIIVNESDFIIK